MSLAFPVDFDSASLRRDVIAMFEMHERAAAFDDDAFHFDVGGHDAVGCLGDERDDIQSLPI